MKVYKINICKGLLQVNWQQRFYCKFGNFCEDINFAKLRMRSFVKINPSRNGKITRSFIDIGKSCLSRDFFTSLICLLMLFAIIKFSRKFPNLQYGKFAGVS